MASGVNNDLLFNSEEFSTLDALLAEVDDTVVKSCEPQFSSNSLNKINDDNVENFLLCKFNQYSGKADNSHSVVSGDSEKDVNNGNELFKHTTNISNAKDDINKISNSSIYKEAILNEFDDKQIYTDPIFGLRIINPQISSVLLTERMAGRKFVNFNELPRHLDLKTASDWVIAAVLLSKEVKCSSKNSSRFTIWKLSDLKGNMKTITIFLFQNAHNELWKTSPGTCVAILNPSFIEKKSYTQDIANLSIESAKKVLILGKSKDFGVCKAKTKNGKQCTNFINLQESDFCVFHIQKEFKKVARPFAKEKINLNGYRINQNASNKSISAHLNSSNILQKDKLILDSLNNPNNNKTPGNISSNTYTVKSIVSSVPQKGYNYGIASKLETDSKQRKTDLERVKSLYSSMNSSNIFSLHEGTIKFKGTETHQIAKLKAFEVLKKRPIEKIDPNSIRGTTGGKKRALDVLNESTDPKRRKIEDNHNLHISEIFKTDSTHTELVNVRQKQEEEKYFNKLESKEAMEEKMLKMFTITCKAVICKECKYTAFSAADRCKTEKHSLKIIDAVKRFFQCKDCGNRTITLFKLPKFSCSNCKGSRWERSAMVRERKLNDSSIPLSIRGDEEKFIGSTVSKMNVNLLVP